MKRGFATFEGASAWPAVLAVAVLALCRSCQLPETGKVKTATASQAPLVDV